MDWGIGGLSVYNALETSLRSCSILYYSDSGATPYGQLAPSSLRQRLVTVIRSLAERYGARHFVVACNAASTVLPGLRTTFEKHGLLVTGVIERGVELVAGTRFRKVGVIGGRRTILSRVFPARLRSSEREVIGRIAQPLSALIERGELDSARLHAALAAILKPLKTCDALLLACTHYPAIAAQIRQHLPDCQLLDPAAATARYVEDHWQDHWRNENRPARKPVRMFVTSGRAAEVRMAASAAFGNRLSRIREMKIEAGSKPGFPAVVSTPDYLEMI